jgi:hypothetical protein
LVKKSPITQKVYDQDSCVNITNILQAKRYLSYLGPSYLLDVLYTDTKREDCLVFVFKKCPETRKAKELWDNHALN